MRATRSCESSVGVIIDDQICRRRSPEEHPSDAEPDSSSLGLSETHVSRYSSLVTEKVMPRRKSLLAQMYEARQKAKLQRVQRVYLGAYQA